MFLHESFTSYNVNFAMFQKIQPQLLQLLKDFIKVPSTASAKTILWAASIFGEITIISTGSLLSATATKCPFPASITSCVPG
jgi:hypothetical protein